MVTQPNELYHYGKKGQKWGVRRYQNADGTLTEAGKKRYARDAREKGYRDYDENARIKGAEDHGSYAKTSKKKGKEDLDFDADRYVTEDLTRSKNLANSTANMTRELQNVDRKHPSKRATLDLSNMSDQQMREEINRANLERQYNDLFAPELHPKRAKGREFVTKTLEIAGTTVVVGAAALDIALKIKELRG
jgi:hypothetical protein